MTTNDPRCLFVTSIVRAPSVRRPREIYYYPSDQRSFLRTCSPTPPLSATRHRRHIITQRLDSRTDPRECMTQTLPRLARQKAEAKRKLREGERQTRDGDRIAVYMQSARKMGKNKRPLLVFRARRRCGAPMPICCAHTPLPPRPGRVRRSFPFASRAAAAVLCRDLISYCLIKPLLAPGVNYK